jgi:hypothetical protein
LLIQLQEAIIRDVFDKLVDQLSSEEGWNLTLAWVRTRIWPNKKEKQFTSQDALAAIAAASQRMKGMRL